ncbi:MAG: response regulator [Clostridiales bacterium]|jgi:two-component system response regulator YesN|nr:response regulator [Clostridiales bacterium]
MIKLLLVDDEPTTRNGLMNHIPWKALGIGEVRSATDGFEALKIAEELDPDIVVSDIRMPGMEGTIFCAHLVNRFTGCKVIFISGYSNEEYLKAAIKIHALSYIEKPIDLDALKTELRKAVEMCLEEQKNMKPANESLPYFKQRILADLTRKDFNPETVLDELAAAKMAVNADGIFVAVILECYVEGEPYPEYSFMILLLETVEKILAGTFCIAAITGSDQITIVLENNGTNAWHQHLFYGIKKAASEYQGCADIFIAVGETASGFRDIPLSYDTAREESKFVFYKGYGHITFATGTVKPPMDIGEEPPACFRNLPFEDEKSLIGYAKSLRQRLLERCNPMVNDVKNFYFYLILTLFNEAEKLGVNLEEMTKSRRVYLWEAVYGFRTLDKATEFLTDAIRFVLSSRAEQDLKRKTIGKVKKFVDGNFSKKLSVKVIAEYFYLSPTYLCYLFKTVTDSTLNEYITAARVEKSKEYLMDKRIKLFEVAKCVGYNDPNYYAKVFKKLTGATPSSFREKYAND